ncbi:MAG: hypothetical protein HWD85_10465 [Flavobacteriaceae bacterium]|nr:hypothetical protein [Flavobacteriaceae bacterium]
MKKLLILFVLISTMNVNAQESTLLRLNYKKGDSYAIKMEMSQEVGTAMSMNMTINMSQKIKTVTGSEYTSEMKFTRMEMDMLQGGMSMSYDSSQKDEDLDEMGKVMKSQMGPILNAVIIVKGNDLGEVLETKVEPSIPQANDFANQSSNVVYPKKKVKVGDTWTFEKKEKNMVMNFIYKVKSITKEKVLLDVSGDVTGMASGKVTGSMEIDRKSGVPVLSKINMDLDAGGQNMLTKMTMTATKN